MAIIVVVGNAVKQEDFGNTNKLTELELETELEFYEKITNKPTSKREDKLLRYLFSAHSDLQEWRNTILQQGYSVNPNTTITVPIRIPTNVLHKSNGRMGAEKYTYK